MNFNTLLNIIIGIIIISFAVSITNHFEERLNSIDGQLNTIQTQTLNMEELKKELEEMREEIKQLPVLKHISPSEKLQPKNKKE